MARGMRASAPTGRSTRRSRASPSKKAVAPTPVNCYLMRKEHGEPALEVADFVMHAVGRQARQNFKKRDDFVLDCGACESGVLRIPVITDPTLGSCGFAQSAPNVYRLGECRTREREGEG